MKSVKPFRPVFPFCRQDWKIPAALLVVFFFGTIAWGVHLVRFHRDQLSTTLFGGTSSTTSAPLVATGVAMTNDQSLNPVRVAVVNIAGLNKPQNGTPPAYVSVGSGVIINPKGYVITAMHLIQNLAEIQVRVQTPMGPRQYPAKLVKAIAQHDLALIKMISQDVFPYLAIDNASPLKVGDPVQSWGDPLGTDAVQKVGTVDSTDLLTPVRVRDVDLTHLIQTSAVVQWAQSGGPLVNDQSQLVGIALALEDPAGLVRGYAIPANILVSHFQDVVSFAQQLPVMANPGAVAQPATPDSSVPAVARPARTADRWWQKVQGALGLNLGKHVALTGTPQPAVPDPTHASTVRLWGYTPESFMGLLLLGFVSGVSGGMMTMGGGIIKVTGLMWFFGYGLVLVRPVAYITNIFMYGAAMLRYHRQGLLRFDYCKPLIPWAMVGIVVGYFIGNIMSKTAIQWLLGLFALLLGIKMLVEISESAGATGGLDEENRLGMAAESGVLTWLQKIFGTRVDGEAPATVKERPATHYGILGLPMGVISGILGITGGVVEVPLQRYIAKMPLRNAIANSATLVFFASLVGTVVALWHGVQTGSFELQTPILMAIILIPGAFAGGLVGAWLTSVIPLNMLRWIYASLMFVISVRMFLS